MTPPDPAAEDEQVAWILERCRSIAVVGLSPTPDRASHRVARYMQARGYRIIPINPHAPEVLGERAYGTLTEAARHERIDLVDVFRQSHDVPPVAEEAMAIGARALWLQLGIAHEASLARARAAGLVAVHNRCLMVDHRHWLARRRKD